MLAFKTKVHLGFSLIEVIVVIALFTILSAIALPSYNQYTANNKALTYTNDLMSVLRLAKSMAVTEHKEIKVCALATGRPSALSCNDTAVDWNKGWYISSLDESNNTLIHKLIQFRSDASQISTGITVDPALSITYSSSGFPTPANFVISIYPPSCTSGYTITSESGGLLKKELVSCPVTP